VLVCNMTSIGGSGTFTSWRIGYRGPRFDHTSSGVCRGLLIEESRANLYEQSEVFNDVFWTRTRSSITANATTAPDGTLTADKFVEDTTASNTHTVQSTVTPSATAHTLSVFAKKGERTWIVLRLGGANTFFNLDDGTIAAGSVNSPTITNFGNGWYRCTVTSSAGTQGQFWLATNSTTTSYTGDGTSGLFLWGAQLEVGSFATSYIPTTTSSLTRSADVCSYTDVSSFYNPEAGTLVGDLILYTPSPLNTTEFFRFGAGNNRIQLGVTNTANEGIRPFIISGGTTTYNSTQGTTVAGTSRKVALTFATNDAISCLNGTLGTQDTSVTMPVSISTAAIGAGALTGNIAAIRYYRKRLPNAKLQAITV
jgi:hypothetical protein